MQTTTRMVQKDFIGRPSCAAERPCEKIKRQPGLATAGHPSLPSCQATTVATLFFPCSGNGNGQSWNNRGSNGNYWSSSFNSARNARNLNFNASGVNPQNTNNRYYGFSVRPVQQSLNQGCALLLLFLLPPRQAMTLTYPLLLRDLYVAFDRAARHKAKMSYVRRFRSQLSHNLAVLALVLLLRVYVPLPSKCFIVFSPKQREVFAAQFPDRVVHHLYFNYTHLIFEATFIRDSYSCIEGRGTLDGVLRLSRHIRQCSHNYQRECYILKLDIRGYFMHIDRRLLLRICLSVLDRMQHHRITKEAAEVFGVSPSKRWKDVLDMDFMRWLTEIIVMLDPKTSCQRAMPPSAWDGLDPAKSLFCTADGCGLPIGNLTSQLFSNVYLNLLDQFCKRQLYCRHYGRYVDDFFIVSCDRRWLLSLVPRIRDFLKEHLGLQLHEGKIRLCRASQGVEFLGAYIKPYRIYISSQTLAHMRRQLKHLDFSRPDKVQQTVNSYLGIMAHTSSYRLRRQLFFRPEFLSIAPFDTWMTKMQPPAARRALSRRRAPSRLRLYHSRRHTPVPRVSTRVQKATPFY